MIGQQFFWSYEYPPSVTGGAPLKSTQLYMPKGDTVYFNMRSKDVIHAFWIPAFRLQEDVVPGITTTLARDARPARQLPGRLQPALRARALADALDGPRRPARPVPGVDQEPAEHGPGGRQAARRPGAASGGATG